MAAEIQLQTSPVQPDTTIYFRVRNSSGLIWQTTTHSFVTFVDANVANYSVAMVESGTSSGYYLGDFPGQITTGTYGVVVYRQSGVSSAVADLPIGQVSTFVWDGSGVEQPATGDDLITLAYAKTLMKIATSAQDTILSLLITAASRSITSYCRKGFKLKTYTEYLDVDHGRRSLFLRNHPINTLSQVTLNPHGDYPEVIAGASYLVNNATGEIGFMPSSWGSSFPSGYQSVKVEYTGGSLIVPEDVQLACAQLVQNAFHASGVDQTVESIKVGDFQKVNISTDGNTTVQLSADVRAILQKYRNFMV